MDSEAVFITESGKYTKRQFSISGGSVGLFEGKRIGRAKNLEKLQKEIKGLEVPEGYTPLYQLLPKLASTGISMNITRHKRLLKICEEIYQDEENLHPKEKEELYKILAEVNPKKYPPKKEEDQKDQ